MPEPHPFNLFVSTSVGGDIARRLGTPHYSYHFAAAAFTAMLTQHDRRPTPLAMPEYYATPAALPARPAGRDVHLIFRSTEHIRLLKPAANIACFAWEFPVLKADILPGEHPFANQVAMLALCDEIWTPSAFAADVLRAHGLDRVRRIPAPVPLPRGGRLRLAEAQAALAPLPTATLDINFAWPLDHQDSRPAAAATLGAWLAAHRTGRRLPIIFLSVLNPEDSRKNLDAMLRGFHALRQAHPGAILLIKAVTAKNRFSLAQVAGGVIRHKLAPGTVLHDPGIAVINAYLTDREMTALYSLADFYLCTSLAEGQNLPLLEAMAHGTVAVTTRNTAMEDYITAKNAFIISTSTVANDSIHLAGTIAVRPFTIAHCRPRDVYIALQSALAAKPDARAAAGIATVERQFSPAAVWPLAAARLAAA